MMLVFKDIKQRKFSSFLTFFAISLGILSIFVIVLISAGFENSIQKQFETLGTNKIIVSSAASSTTTLNFAKGLSDNEADLLKNKAYIKDVFPSQFKKSYIEYSRENQMGNLNGIDITKDYFDNFGLNLDKGRFAKSNEKYSVILGSEFAKNTFDKEINVGSNIYIKGFKFKVIGILKSVGNSQDDSNVYIDIDTFRDIYEIENKQVAYLFVITQENTNVELAAKNIDLFLENRLGKDSISTQTFAQMLESFNDILKIIQMTLGGIALVSLIVGALGIINTMYVIVTEKIKEIGIYKSIGATNSLILFMFMFQSGVFGFFGALLGIILGIPLVIIFENVAQSAGFGFLEISIDYMVILLLLVFGFIIGIFSGYLPARQASKLNLIDAIRR